MRTWWLLAAGVGVLAGCTREPPRRVYPWDAAPEALRTVAQRAQAPTQALQQTLGGRLTKQLAETGPLGALHVCRDEAQALTKGVREAQGVQLGRTSARLRNPTNAPPDWARDVVAANTGRPLAEVPRHVVDLGDAVGVLTPLPTGAMCTTCHGPALAPDVQKALSAAYPQDAATGFTEGQVRGFVWAVVPRG